MRRRELFKLGLTAAAAWGLPTILPRSVFGNASPNERINIALIGCGNQSTLDLPAFLQNDDVQVVAVCDVNRGSHGYLTPKQFLGREPQQKFVNDCYAKKAGAGSYRGCDAYRDFRDVIGRKDVDVVVIVVPDHWHAPITVMAAQAGKDIYCEKPLSLTIAHGQAMVRAVHDRHRILQTGSHFRSSTIARHACELVRNGRIGQLKRIETFMAKINAVDPGPGWKPMPVPEGFDYDLWLGPAPAVPYHKDRCLYRFRFNLDYSGGQTTNFGAHCNDLAQWAQGKDHTAPVEFEDTAAEFPPKGSLYNSPTKVSFRARYADGVDLICHTCEPYFGTRFEGTKGWVQMDFKGITSHPASLATSVIGPNEIHLSSDRSKPVMTRYDGFQTICDHVRNFLDAVKLRRDPIEPVEVGHQTATICHLGNIAMLLKRKIRWNPETQQIVGDDEANRMLSRPMRAPSADRACTQLPPGQLERADELDGILEQKQLSSSKLCTSISLPFRFLAFGGSRGSALEVHCGATPKSRLALLQWRLPAELSVASRAALRTLRPCATQSSSAARIRDRQTAKRGQTGRRRGPQPAGPCETAHRPR